MVVENTKFLGQRWRALVLTAQQAACSSCSCWFPLATPSSQTRQRGPCECHACRGFAFQPRSSGLREPKSFIKDICTKRRHHSTRQKTNLPPALEGDPTSSKAICYKNILEKMGQNKSGQWPCSQDRQKHRELSQDKSKNSYTPIVLTVH